MAENVESRLDGDVRGRFESDEQFGEVLAQLENFMLENQINKIDVGWCCPEPPVVHNLITDIELPIPSVPRIA